MNIKTTIKDSLKQLIADRYLLILLSALILFTLSFAIIIGLSIRPSELQLVSHYSAFGSTHLYRDQWFYLFTFVGFGLITTVLNTIIAIKIFLVKGHSLATMFAWLSAGIILLAWITATSLLNVWTPL